MRNIDVQALAQVMGGNKHKPLSVKAANKIMLREQGRVMGPTEAAAWERDYQAKMAVVGPSGFVCEDRPHIYRGC